MSLPIPKLDDRSFSDLAEEVRSLIPRYSKEWSNFNPSDPGITLLELFAWLTEMVIYRIDQIPPDHIRRYLELIGMIETNSSESLESAITRAVKYVSSQYRFVNAGDYEDLALEALKKLHPELSARIICVIDRNMELINHSEDEKRGHISLIVLPSKVVPGYCEKVGIPEAGLLDYLKDELNESRILTHRLHFVPPAFVPVEIKTELILEIGADLTRVIKEVKLKLNDFFDPVTGGSDQQGWPIGRYLYRSEIYEILEGVSDVAYTKSATIDGSETKKFVEIGAFKFIEIVIPDENIAVIR